jgi:cation diffusion facilitator CzcD-associated flavoprotein CzcO
MIEAVIVGGGPYGLTIAAHLRAKNVPHRVFGAPMRSWIDHMPEGMYLKSEGHASNLDDPRRELTLERFCRERGVAYGAIGVPVSLSTFVEYGQWFQQHAVPQLESAEVSSVHRREAGGFDVGLATGEELVARRVIVATGVAAHRFVPDELAAGGVRVSHTADHASLVGFDGFDVAVVGSGQSAIESAALLHEAGARTTIVARRPGLVWNTTPATSRRSLPRRVRAPIGGLGAGWKLWTYASLPQLVRRFPEEPRVRIAFSTLGPAGAWWLRPRVTSEIAIRTGHAVVAAEPAGERVRLTFGDAEPLEVDHVLAGTGYRFRLERLAFLDAGPVELLSGSPRLSRAFESTVPGLHFVGLPAAPTFGPVMRFVYGAGFTARRIAAAL